LQKILVINWITKK